MQFDRHISKKLADLERRLRQKKLACEALFSPAPAMSRNERKLFQANAAEETELVRANITKPLDLFAFGNERSGPEGRYYEICLPVAAWDESAGKAVERSLNFWRHFLQQSAWQIESPIIYFDAETAGLLHAPLFLAGLLQINLQSGECCIRQLLAREYAEEPAVLYEAVRLLQEADLVVTFNGHSFDLPFLRSRLRYHRLGPLCVRQHLDLLPRARRILGRTYGDCKLDTLGRHLCGRWRSDNIPSQQIPQAYHDYVREKHNECMQRILWHNAEDLITLAEITATILAQNK